MILSLVVKGELKVEEEIDILEEEEEEGEEEVSYKVEEYSKEELEGIIQEVKKETSNVTIVTSMDIMSEKID